MNVYGLCLLCFEYEAEGDMQVCSLCSSLASYNRAVNCSDKKQAEADAKAIIPTLKERIKKYKNQMSTCATIAGKMLDVSEREGVAKKKNMLEARKEYVDLERDYAERIKHVCIQLDLVAKGKKAPYRVGTIPIEEQEKKNVKSGVSRKQAASPRTGRISGRRGSGNRK